MYSPTAGPDVIDIRKLYAQGGVFTYDPGFTSTAVSRQRHHLHRRRQGRTAASGLSHRPTGREIALTSKSATCCCMANCRPADELEEFEVLVTNHTMLHEQMQFLFRGFRRDAHPMAVMVGVVGAMSAFYHDSTDINDPRQREVAAIRLIAKMPTIAAMGL